MQMNFSEKNVTIICTLIGFFYRGPCFNLGPSKNYVTARGGEGVDDFVTYRYVYFERGGVIYEVIYVTADT